jgi:hypothetical protein
MLQRSLSKALPPTSKEQKARGQSSSSFSLPSPPINAEQTVARSPLL